MNKKYKIKRGKIISNFYNQTLEMRTPLFPLKSGLERQIAPTPDSLL